MSAWSPVRRLSGAAACGLVVLSAMDATAADIADMTGMRIDRNANGTPRFLDVSDLAGVIATTGDWGARARAVVTANGELFGIGDAARELSVLRIDTDAAGNTHVHFGQTYAGVRVEGARLTVHFDRNGDPTSVTGLVQPSPDLATAAEISTDDAVRTARQAVRRATAATGLVRAEQVEVVMQVSFIATSPVH
jgi:hypothetical protein